MHFSSSRHIQREACRVRRVRFRSSDSKAGESSLHSNLFRGVMLRCPARGPRQGSCCTSESLPILSSQMLRSYKDLGQKMKEISCLRAGARHACLGLFLPLSGVIFYAECQRIIAWGVNPKHASLTVFKKLKSCRDP